MRNPHCTIVIVCITVHFVPAPALAQRWTDFLLKPFENGAFLETFTSWERDHNRSGARSQRWTDTFLKEKLTVYSIGYSYHPRFVQYRLSLAGAGKHEKYDSSEIENVGWNHDGGVEYDATLFFLPEHVYNLEAYARRFEPVFKEQAATHHDNVEDSYGASFRYRDKPYFVHASVDDDSIESGEIKSDVTNAAADAQYFNRFTNGYELSFNGAVSPTWFSNSEGLDGSAIEYHAGNLVNIRGVRLDSNVTQNSFDQESRSAGEFDSDQFAWYERLSAELPWNFRSDLWYRQQDNESKIDEPLSGRSQTLENDGKDLQFDLIHRLYESVDTTYTFLQNWRNSTGSDTTAQSNSVTVNYTKAIPWDSRLLTGGSFSRTDTDNSGDGTDIINESYPAIAVPGSFTLRQQNVEPNTIDIFLRSPLPPFELILLVENVNYVLIPAQSSFEVRVLALPPEFVVPGTYDFFASYSLTAGNFDLRTDVFGGNISVELFNTRLTPYFSYVQVGSNVTSGSFPGVPVDSTTYTTGLIYLQGPLRLRGEYQELQWDVSPSEAWRAEAQYVQSLSATTNVYSSVSYLNKHYGRGTGVYTDRAFTDETTTAFATIRKQLLRNMYVSVGGSYTRLSGLVDGNAYSAHASWVWNVGKLELSGGASAYGSDSNGTDSVSTERDHQLVYARLRRKLF